MLKYNVILSGKTVLVTGVAGFIGSNLGKRLLREVEGIKVVGIDNMNDYYDVRLKEERLKELSSHESFVFIKGNIADKNLINKLFDEYKPQVVVNLAPRQVYATASLILMPIYLLTSLVSTTSWKLAVIATTMDREGWNIWSMPVQAVYMAATRKCLTPPMTRWTIQSACMPLPKRATN